MIIKTLGKYNITPPIEFFQGRLCQVSSKDLGKITDMGIEEGSVILMKDSDFSMPKIIKMLQLKPRGIIFQKGGAFYHPAIHLGVEGIPCFVGPDKNMSPFNGEIVFCDLNGGTIKINEDICDENYVDADEYYKSIEAENYSTKLNVNVCIRSARELEHFRRLKDAGITVPFITLFMEPIIYKCEGDPYVVSKSNKNKIREILREYFLLALGIAQQGVYVRTPEVTAKERGSKEKHASGLEELRGIPYDLQKDLSFIDVLFELVAELASEPGNKGRLHIALAMPRSAKDVAQASKILEAYLAGAKEKLEIGKDINLTIFAETPYWLFPTKALSDEVKQLCMESYKEEFVKDSNKKILWGTGDLTATFMASSREIPEMCDYLLTKAEVIDAMRKSIQAWNSIGFKPDINGSLACKPFKNDEDNIKFFSLIMEGNMELSVFPNVFLEVKKLVKEAEKRKGIQS